MQVKIGNNENQTINTSLQAQEKAAKGARKEAVKRKNTIFAGDLPINKDPIELRKQQAQKKAMKFVKDAWAGDRKLDQSQEEIRAKLRELLDESEANQELAQGNTERIKNLRQKYGVDADSQEQKDLDLLMKAANQESLTEDEEARLAEMGPQREYLALLSKKMISTEPFTESDKARLDELGESLTEYQRSCLEINEERSVYQRRDARTQNYIQELQSSLTDMKIERLKYHKMVDAQEKADKVMEQASEEIVGLLVDEAKDHVDETYEEQREAAEKKAEEKEEQEEKQEKIEKQRELIEARVDAAQEQTHEAREAQREQERDAREEAQLMKDMAEGGLDVAGTSAAVKAEIKDMLQKMKLIEADIKGIEVDEEI
ncbi:MAG: hypothetical protein HDR07_09565 [Lachnospiraceae bacterium]|nr:hypothetical protein [Lachnospiraceae bacterium]